MRFEGKSVVVTGASSGMGYDIAKQFAAEGATVVAVARRKERLEQLAAEAEELPGKIIPYAGDISSLETNEGMIACAVEATGKLDILVNNAGVMDEFKPIGEVTDADWEKVISINLNGPMYAMRKAVQVMAAQEKGGNIVNIASIGGVNGCRAGAAYTASKHALIGLTKNTAFMYVDKGIRCNAICPGGVATEVMNSQTNICQVGMARVMAGLDTTIPGGNPADITAAVLYIAGDEAGFVNGSVFVIDGGVSCN
ncbi:MAG: SDR family oxidoreductase [Lachnospiraceae bacterium]|nr:SDR family oxidoreductase [Lachnospiraceae bacterium]